MCACPNLNIAWFDSAKDDISAQMTQLRKMLSPKGDVVSEAGRKKTIEIFGEALSPQQVVERICRDVEEKGLEAVLDYSKRIDGADLKPEELRPPPAFAPAYVRFHPRLPVLPLRGS